MDLSGKSLILSSKSPRRAELLGLAGIPFEIKVRPVDETLPGTVDAPSAAEYLAKKKAEVHRKDLSVNQIILAADTTVVLDNKVFGKPAHREDAIETLLALSGKEHAVYTGVCLLSSEKHTSFTEKSFVKFDKISIEEAAYYFDNFNPVDKAGSYGIQDWIGKTKVEYIQGSYTNILGLPLAQTLRALEKFISRG